MLSEIGGGTAEQQLSPEEIFSKVRHWYAGDLHAHSTHTNRGEIADAGNREVVHSPRKVIGYARRLGLNFVALSEHSTSPDHPRVMSPDHPILDQIRAQNAAVRSINEEAQTEAFTSVEANILIDENGQAVVDVPESVLAGIDYSIASIHNIENANKRDPFILRELLLAGVNNPYVDAVGHPYRHVEFYDYDWDYFRKYWEGQVLFVKDPEEQKRAVEISAAIKRIKQSGNDDLHKVIGKIDIQESDPNQEALHEMQRLFKKLESQYWTMWTDVLAKMEETGTVFEINLNTFNPNKQFYRKLLQLTTQYPNLNYSIVYDFHNLKQRDEIKEKDLPYKPTGPLFPSKKGPSRLRKGREFAVRRLYETILLLEEGGITPERVINSSSKAFADYRREREKRRAEYAIATHSHLRALSDATYLCGLLNVDHIDSWHLDDFTRDKDGNPEKILIEVESGDKVYRLIRNTKYSQEPVFDVMSVLYSEIPEETVRPIGKTNIDGSAVIAYEAIPGVDVRTAAESMKHEERVEMIRNLAKLSGEIHSVKPEKFQGILNQDNSSIMQIVDTINHGTIERIAAFGDSASSIAAELLEVYETLAEKERFILETSGDLSLIHGDWHPGNVIIKPDGTLCVIDYKSFTYGVAERDVASMLQQIHDQFLQRIPNITEQEIVEYQQAFLGSYPHPLDPQKIEFYKAWISWRNSLFHYARHYLGGKYNDNGRECLSRAKTILSSL